MGNKVYIASTLSNSVRVQKLGKRLRDLGIEITYDWTTHNNGVPYVSDDQPEHKRIIGEYELKGVFDADCVLVVMPGGSGTHFEFGFAYALQKRIVLLLDEHKGQSPSFHFMNEVARVFSEEEAIQETIKNCYWLNVGHFVTKLQENREDRNAQCNYNKT